MRLAKLWLASLALLACSLELGAFALSRAPVLPTIFSVSRRRSFPYLLALARGVRSPAVQLTLARRRDPLAAWHTPKLRDALPATLDRFISTSEAHGFAPLIVWIPQAAYLRHALREVSLELETAFVGRAAFVAVAGSGHDWARFAEPGCHPGREGYGIIARHVVAALRGL